MADRMSPWTVTHGKVSANSDLFDFDLAVMNQPTTQQGRVIVDCEGYAYMHQRLMGGNSDTGSFTVDPSTTGTAMLTGSFYDLFV